MKEDRIYLLHIRDAIERIRNYTGTGRDDFFRDSKTQDAVLRNIEVIGEAAKRLTPSVKNLADLPWKQIAGMRDKLIHEYFGVNLNLVWEVVERELPRLERAIDQLIGEQKSG